MEESCGPDLSGSESKGVKYSCEHGNENFGAVKREEYLEYLNKYQFFRGTLFHGFDRVRYIIRSNIG
jgi:hypothetical protein